MSAEVRREALTDISSDLQDLILESADVEEFLSELAALSGTYFSTPESKVRCSLTLLRRKRAAMVASSDASARALDEIQRMHGGGPGLVAMKDMTTVHVPELGPEVRWSEYVSAAASHGIRSILAVPMELDSETSAALNLFSSLSNRFTDEDIEGAATFAEHIAKSLRLALRIAQLSNAKDDLAAAMQSRTTINLAVGAIMAQNRCSQEEAMTILKNASSTRNSKLREVATSVVMSITDKPLISTYFDE